MVTGFWSEAAASEPDKPDGGADQDEGSGQLTRCERPRDHKEGCPVTHRCFSMKAVIRASSTLSMASRCPSVVSTIRGLIEGYGAR